MNEKFEKLLTQLEFIDAEEYGGKLIVICGDDNTDWVGDFLSSYNLGLIWSASRDVPSNSGIYEVDVLQSLFDNGEIRTATEIEEYLDNQGYFFLPVYAYVHGGVAINTGGFSCPWDSGLAGYIFTTRERIRELMGWKRISKKRHSKIYDILKEEINILNAYLNGMVFRYSIYDENGELWSEGGGYIEEKDALKDAKIEIDLLTGGVK